MNTLLKLVVLSIALLTLAGCAAQASMPVRETDPVSFEADGPFRVQAQGIAYLGDTETLRSARERAWEQAKQRAVAQGARTYIESYRRTEFGALTDDVVESAVAAILSEIHVLDEGLVDTSYRIRIEALVKPEDVHNAIAYRRSGVPAPVSNPSPMVEVAEAVLDANQLPTQADMFTICCRDFPESLVHRVRPTLERALGVNHLERTDNLDDVCYHVGYSGDREMLERWLNLELRTSPVSAFRVLRGQGASTLLLHHDGGFD